jgi:hypothetical protein
MDAVLGWNLVLSLPVILVIAWLAGRLLGVSRSLPGTVLAGMAGWLAALALRRRWTRSWPCWGPSWGGP